MNTEGVSSYQGQQQQQFPDNSVHVSTYFVQHEEVKGKDDSGRPQREWYLIDSNGRRHRAVVSGERNCQGQYQLTEDFAHTHRLPGNDKAAVTQWLEHMIAFRPSHAHMDMRGMMASGGMANSGMGGMVSQQGPGHPGSHHTNMQFTAQGGSGSQQGGNGMSMGPSMGPNMGSNMGMAGREASSGPGQGNQRNPYAPQSASPLMLGPGPSSSPGFNPNTSAPMGHFAPPSLNGQKRSSSSGIPAGLSQKPLFDAGNAGGMGGGNTLAGLNLGNPFQAGSCGVGTFPNHGGMMPEAGPSLHTMPQGGFGCSGIDGSGLGLQGMPGGQAPPFGMEDVGTAMMGAPGIMPGPHAHGPHGLHGLAQQQQGGLHPSAAPHGGFSFPPLGPHPSSNSGMMQHVPAQQQSANSAPQFHNSLPGFGMTAQGGGMDGPAFGSGGGTENGGGGGGCMGGSMQPIGNGMHSSGGMGQQDAFGGQLPGGFHPSQQQHVQMPQAFNPNPFATASMMAPSHGGPFGNGPPKRLSGRGSMNLGPMGQHGPMGHPGYGTQQGMDGIGGGQSFGASSMAGPMPYGNQQQQQQQQMPGQPGHMGMPGPMQGLGGNQYGPMGMPMQMPPSYPPFRNGPNGSSVTANGTGGSGGGAAPPLGLPPLDFSPMPPSQPPQVPGYMDLHATPMDLPPGNMAMQMQPGMSMPMQMPPMQMHGPGAQGPCAELHGPMPPGRLPPNITIQTSLPLHLPSASLPPGGQMPLQLNMQLNLPPMQGASVGGGTDASGLHGGARAGSTPLPAPGQRRGSTGQLPQPIPSPVMSPMNLHSPGATPLSAGVFGGGPFLEGGIGGMGGTGTGPGRPIRSGQASAPSSTARPAPGRGGRGDGGGGGRGRGGGRGGGGAAAAGVTSGGNKHKLVDDA